MNITKEQKEILEEYSVFISDDINDINDILLALDAKITEVGFDANYDLNESGLKLQKLYDEIYNQN